MKNKSRIFIIFFTLVVFFLFALAISGQKKADPMPWDKGKIQKIDITKYPKKQKKYYGTFVKKCGNCHSLARTFNAPYNEKIWPGVIKRMMVKSDAKISKKDGKKIYRFLKFFVKQKKK